MTPFQCVMKYKEEVEKKLGKQILAQTEKYATHKYENVGQAGGKVCKADKNHIWEHTSAWDRQSRSPLDQRID